MFYFVLFPLDRLLVYEGSLYRLKCIVKQQMRKNEIMYYLLSVLCYDN